MRRPPTGKPISRGARSEPDGVPPHDPEAPPRGGGGPRGHRRGDGAQGSARGGRDAPSRVLRQRHPHPEARERVQRRDRPGGHLQGRAPDEPRPPGEEGGAPPQNRPPPPPPP